CPDRSGTQRLHDDVSRGDDVAEHPVDGIARRRRPEQALRMCDAGKVLMGRFVTELEQFRDERACHTGALLLSLNVGSGIFSPSRARTTVSNGRKAKIEPDMTATGKSLAAVKTGPSTTEFREFDLPDIPVDAALLKIEVAGVCGTDVSQYKLPL